MAAREPDVTTELPLGLIAEGDLILSNLGGWVRIGADITRAPDGYIYAEGRDLHGAETRIHGHADDMRTYGSYSS